MPNAQLIVNPAASQFTGGMLRTVAAAIGKRYQVEVAWPQGAVEARQTALDAARSGFDLVVAMGGDGMVHHVGQALVGTGTPLGIIPAGTTNVIARLSGIPDRPAPAARMLAGDNLLTPIPRLDLVYRIGDRMERRSSFFATGLGPDAAIVEVAETEPFRKYRFGSVHYARTSMAKIRTDLRKRPPDVMITCDGVRTPAIGFMAQFRPAYTYVGRRGKQITLSTDRETAMSVAVVQHLRLRNTPRLIRATLSGSGVGDVPGITLLDGVSSIHAACDHPVELQADGEFLGSVDDLEATLRPEGLVLVTPAPRRSRS